MSLWVDKYRPKSLAKLQVHAVLNEKLAKLAASDDLPHLLFCGPSGAGKQTRIQAMLEELYGSAVEKKKIEFRPYETPSGKKIELSIISSAFHVELNPSDAGIYDRIIVQEMVKEIAQTQQIHGITKNSGAKEREFKVLVIQEAENLSKDAQHALRRTMEKYMRNMRIILCCDNGTRLIAPLRSRCLVIRVPAPTDPEMHSALNYVMKQENIQIPSAVTNHIVQASEGNLRKALLQLECIHAKATHAGTHLSSLKPDSVPITDWEGSIGEICSLMIQEQSTANILKVRAKFYELLSHCIPPSTIMLALVKNLLQSIDQSEKSRLLSDAAEYEFRIQQGQKAIFHLEAFVARFMCSYKKFIAQMCE